MIPEVRKFIFFFLFFTATQLCPDESTDEGHACDYYKRLSDKIDVHTITLIAPQFPDITQVKPRTPIYLNGNVNQVYYLQHQTCICC